MVKRCNNQVVDEVENTLLFAELLRLTNTDIIYSKPYIFGFSLTFHPNLTLFPTVE